MQSRLDDLLRAGRQVHPPVGAEERIWTAVEHRLAHGPPPAAEAVSSGLGSTLYLKLLVGLALVAAGVGAVSGNGDGGASRPMQQPPLTHMPPPPAQPAVPQPTPSVVESPAAFQTTQAGPQPVVPQRAKPEPGERRALAKQPARPFSSHPAVHDERVGATSDDFIAELQLIADVRDALARADSAGALKKIHEHRRRFGSGQFVQERMALQVEALCGLGRVSAASDVAVDFLARWPDSTHAPSVRDSCAGM